MVIQPDLTLLGGGPANRDGQSELDEDIGSAVADDTNVW